MSIELRAWPGAVAPVIRTVPNLRGLKIDPQQIGGSVYRDDVGNVSDRWLQVADGDTTLYAPALHPADPAPDSEPTPAGPVRKP
jgi:hypothetical protein